METAIIVALISLVGTLTGTFSGIWVSSKLTIYRIEQLEKKVDKFAELNSKIYDLEMHNAVQDEQIKTTKEEIISLRLGE